MIHWLSLYLHTCLSIILHFWLWINMSKRLKLQPWLIFHPRFWLWFDLRLFFPLNCWFFVSLAFVQSAFQAIIMPLEYPSISSFHSLLIAGSPYVSQYHYVHIFVLKSNSNVVSRCVSISGNHSVPDVLSVFISGTNPSLVIILFLILNLSSLLDTTQSPYLAIILNPSLSIFQTLIVNQSSVSILSINCLSFI